MATTGNVRVNIKIKETFQRVSYQNIIKANIIDEIQEWILDIVLDSYIYEQKRKPLSEFIQLPEQLKDKGNYQVIISENGRNESLRNILNKFLRLLLD